MADSNITKRALAASLKALMDEMPFEKINVADICERCDMNRKSFYYHFKDKYDLVNWIFDTEFMEFAVSGMSVTEYSERWAFFEKACDYFYENRDFYRRVLRIKGQNSFIEHFREIISPIFKDRMVQLFEEEMADDFVADCFTDAVVSTLERWLLEKECMRPKEFVAKIKRLIQGAAAFVYREMEQE